MGQMKLLDYEDILTEQYGEIGTPRRDQFERQVDEAVHAYRIGEAVKKLVCNRISPKSNWANVLE